MVTIYGCYAMGVTEKKRKRKEGRSAGIILPAVKRLLPDLSLLRKLCFNRAPKSFHVTSTRNISIATEEAIIKKERTNFFSQCFTLPKVRRKPS